MIPNMKSNFHHHARFSRCCISFN